jgi:heme-degrading monooxygenase HmoA
MFARVITADAGDAGSDKLIRLADQQLPGARQLPGFAGFFLLVDDDAGKVMNISLWETREAMEAVAQGTSEGVHDEGVADTGLRSLQLETYEVAVQA